MTGNSKGNMDKKNPGEKLGILSWALDTKGTQLIKEFQITKCYCWVAEASKSSLNWYNFKYKDYSGEY